METAGVLFNYNEPLPYEMLGIWDENEKQCCKMLYWYLHTCSPEGTCGRCLSAYPHFAGQFPHFSKCKALTIIQRIHVVCRKMLGALALGTKRASFQGLDSWPNHTAELVTSPSSGGKYWFPALPLHPHSSPVCFGKVCGQFLACAGFLCFHRETKVEQQRLIFSLKQENVDAR